MLGPAGYKVLQGVVSRATPGSFSAAVRRAWGQDDQLLPQLATGNYDAGAVHRDQVETGVYDVMAGAPKELPVQFHNELSYTQNYPRYVAFGCYVQAERGGETLLSCMRSVTASIDKELLAKLQRLGVRYTRNLTDSVQHKKNEDSAPPFYAHWQDTFNTDDVHTAIVKANLSCEDSWQLDPDDGTLSIYLNRRATVSLDQEEVLNVSILDFFDFPYDVNHEFDTVPSHAKPLHCCWGDGSIMHDEEIDHLRKVQHANSISLNLKTGDAVVVDNLKWAHGRRPYEGKRKLGLIMSPLRKRDQI